MPELSLLVRLQKIPRSTLTVACSPPLICPQNVDFVIFMQWQCLLISVKLSPLPVDSNWETQYAAMIYFYAKSLHTILKISVKRRGHCVFQSRSDKG